MIKEKIVLLFLFLLPIVAYSQPNKGCVEKKYTVKEIDELRYVCESRYLYGTAIVKSGISRTYIEIEKITAVEEMVRTYAMLGITAKDIIDEDKRKRKERKMWFDKIKEFNESKDDSIKYNEN